MASKRHQRRIQERLKQEKTDRQCRGKIVYPDQRRASLSARAISIKRGIELVAYPCPICSTAEESRWHVGHDVTLRGDRSADRSADPERWFA